MLLRRKWLILFAALCGTGIGYLQFLKQEPVYQSQARILVVARRPRIPAEGVGGVGYRDHLPTHAILIKSPLIIRDAVDNSNLSALPSLANSGNPVSAIIRGLGIQQEEDADILNLSFTSSNSIDCTTILAAVLKSYQRFLEKTRQEFSDETVQLITEAKDVLMKQLDDEEKKYREFRTTASEAILWGRDGAEDIHQSRLGGIEATRAKIRISRAETKAQLDWIRKELNAGNDRQALLMMLEKVGKPVAGGVSQPNQLVSMMLEEQLLLDDHGPDHPKVKALRRRMELIRGQELGVETNKETRDVFAVYVESLEKQLRSNQEQENYLNDLFTEEQEASKSQEVFQIKDETFNKSIDRKQKLFDTIIARLEEINLNKDQSGFDAQTLNPASGAWQVGPDFAQNLTMAGLLGALVGLGFGYVLELADRSYHSPDEIVRELETPVVGHIPVIVENRQAIADNSPLHWSLSTVHHPKSRIAEAYRGVRTAIYFNAQDTQHQTIQITSPNPGDGKSTLAVNLAISIANSGKSVLILDCDLRRPRVARILGIKESVGLEAAIVGQTELTDLPQDTSVPNLQAIVSTDKPENPSELLTSPEFHNLLETFRTKYDYVILDTPPTLAVTDPGIVAARVDGVILAIRLTKKSRQHSKQAMELLNSIGATVIGVVVNGIGDRSGYGGYGRNTYYTYGKYRYGYAYGYGYGYGYGNGYGSYYAEDKAKQRKRKQARDQARIGITNSTNSNS